MRRTHRALGAASLLLLTACAGVRATAPTRSSTVITREELAAGGVAQLMAFDAIQRLRPSWLTARGVASMANSPGRFPGVLVNGSARDNIDVLRTLPVEEIETLRFLDARDATTR